MVSVKSEYGCSGFSILRGRSPYSWKTPRCDVGLSSRLHTHTPLLSHMIRAAPAAEALGERSCWPQDLGFRSLGLRMYRAEGECGV